VIWLLQLLNINIDMTYAELFKRVLLEQDLPAPSSNPSHMQTPGAEGNIMDDPDTSHQLLTKGIKSTQDAVQANFNEKMNKFSQAFNPEVVKQMPFGHLKAEVSKVHKYINSIQIFAKQKIDQLAQNPQALIAAFINSDPEKQSAFENLFKELDDFMKSMSEMESKIAALKGKIDDFVSDVQEIDDNSAEQQGPPEAPEGPPPPSVEAGL
jgi:DNA-binding protein YbaB